jgi:hypothetical protein
MLLEYSDYKCIKYPSKTEFVILNKPHIESYDSRIRPLDKWMISWALGYHFKRFIQCFIGLSLEIHNLYSSKTPKGYFNFKRKLCENTALVINGIYIYKHWNEKWYKTWHDNAHCSAIIVYFVVQFLHTISQLETLLFTRTMEDSWSKLYLAESYQ